MFFFGMICLLLGGVALPYTAGMLLRRLRLRAWRPAAGCVRAADATGGGVIPLQNRLAWALPAVWYEYHVEGTRYEGAQGFAAGALTGAQGAVERVLRRYPVGGPVTVYYDPREPGRSTLLWEPVRPLAVRFGVALGVAVVGLGLLAWAA